MQSPFDRVIPPLSLISRERIKHSITAAGNWLLEAVRAAGCTGKGAGFRDIIYYKDGSFRWYYPHSNLGEQIDSFLDLWEATGEPHFLEGARTYATRMLADPERGLYQGENKEAYGLAFYWRETGSYTGMYSMRAIAPLYRLSQLTGEARLRRGAEMIADTLLRDVLPSGIPRHFAWIPGEGFPTGKVGSRVGYLIGVYAFCSKTLGDPRAEGARQRMRTTLSRIQKESGAFPQDITMEGEPGDPSIKNHFFGYILNGLSQSLALIPDDHETRQIALRLADFAKAQVDYFGTTPYCASADNKYATDQAALFHPVTDPAPALIKLAHQFNRPDYHRAAAQIWLLHLMRQIHAPDAPAFHGAIPTTVDPLVRACDSLLTIGKEGVPHLKHDPTRAASCSTYYINQYIQAGCLFLKEEVQAGSGVLTN